MGYIGAGITRFNTADELTVTGDAQIDTTTLVVDSTNNRVGVGTASPTTALDVTGTVTADGLDVQGDGTISGGSRLTISAIADVNNDGVRLDDSTTSRFNNLTQDSSGNFKIQHWTGSAWQNNLTLTTGGNLGIGTTTPTFAAGGGVHAKGSSGAFTSFRASADSNTGVDFSADSSGNGYVFNRDNGAIIVGTNNSEKVRITSGGDVGIGESNPSLGSSANGLHITGASGNDGVLKLDSSDTTHSGKIQFTENGTDQWRIAYDPTNNHLEFTESGVADRMVIADGGNVGIGTASPISNSTTNLHVHTSTVGGSSELRLTNGSTGATASDGLQLQMYQGTEAYINNRENGPIIFKTNNTEAARLDSSQNLLVGTTTTLAGSDLTGGEEGFVVRSIGLTIASRDSGNVMLLNRNTNDGEILTFKKDGTTVGSIRSEGGDIVFGNDTRGLKFRDADVIPRDMDNTTADNVVSLGSSTSRFQDLYLSGGAYIGGTAAANQLDDYEEGSFSPTVLGTGGSGTFTYNQRNGRYVKVGNQVTIHIYLEVNITVAGSGSLRIDDLPFNGHSSVYQAISTAHDTLSSSNAGAAFVQPSADFMEFTDGGTTSRRGFPGTGTRYIFVGGTYLTQF